ncbi:MAG: M28 family peptidase [Pyrinomonadaceae bacterium]
MKFCSKDLWQKPVALVMLAGMLSIQGFAQMTAARTPVKNVSLSKTEQALVKNIRLDSVKSYTNALAADEMEGRGTMQPGGDKAANWIADQFQKLGLKPLGADGSYLQPIDFTQTIFGDETKFQAGDNTFKLGKDYGFVPLPFKKTDSSVEADMLFIGYGLHLMDVKSNPNALADVRGKAVVMIDGPPASISKENWESSNSNLMIYQALIVSGAKAIIIVGHGREDDSTETYIDYFGRRQVSLTNEAAAFSPFTVPPMMMVSKQTAAKLFAKADIDFKSAVAKAEGKDFVSVDLKEKASIVTKYESTSGKSSNVVGYIEGSDPNLKSEAVLFSAHYDAYGLENGNIYNGAADNALGTAEMLAVAEAYSKMDPKPKRSMIFLAVTGEEYGLYGSKYWADNPTWSLDKVAANLNLDGIGTEVYGPVKNMVGFGAEHSTLGPMLDDVARSYGISMIPDPQPEEKVFTRSDHYSFVQRGVPALMLMGAPAGTKDELVAKIKAWEKVNYHQPTDDVMANWHWEGAKTVADMMGILGLRISNQTEMPKWLPGSEYSKTPRGGRMEPETDD